MTPAVSTHTAGSDDIHACRAKIDARREANRLKIIEKKVCQSGLRRERATNVKGRGRTPSASDLVARRVRSEIAFATDQRRPWGARKEKGRGRGVEFRPPIA